MDTYSIVVVGNQATNVIRYQTGQEVTIARHDVTLLPETYLKQYVSTAGLPDVYAALADLGIEIAWSDEYAQVADLG